MEETKQGEERSDAPGIIIYSSPSCQYCNMAKTYLLERKLAFTDIDVSKDQEKAREMVKKSGQAAVPVLEINGRIVVGFDRQLIDDALKRRKPLTRDEFLGNLIFDPFGTL
ncbi:MAG: glutaredoxin family protein [Candidatus Micrarchaeota archaeon]